MAETFEEKIESMKEVCKSYCGECPSYTGTGETSLVFCTMGKSSIINQEKAASARLAPSQK